MATYRFGEVINQGGFGEIVTVSCLDDCWTGVAKRLRTGATSEDIARFIREGKLLTLMAHKNVVSARAVKLSGDSPWFAMERSDENLQTLVERVGPGEGLLPRFLEVCEGVEHAHENGILHRDLKPQNVLVYGSSTQPTCVVTDFGLGKHFDGSTAAITQTNAAGWGTQAYMAPEQAVDFKNINLRVDVYALGKILYFVLTGKLPWHVNVQHVDPKFRHIVAKATDSEPDRRYASVAELVESVNLAARGSDLFVSPVELFKSALQEVESNPSAQTNNKLIQLLISRIDDESFMGTELPHLTTPAMKTLFQTDLFRMKQLVCAYDGMLSDQLPYSYCDTVADFYNSVCWATQDQELRQMILVRLASIGPEHNRWHVGEVLGAIVGRTQDPGALLGLAEHFKRFPAAANWNRQYLEPLPQVLREAMPGL